MVQKAMQYIDETPDLDTRIELIKTLNSVSAGKVYLYTLCIKTLNTGTILAMQMKNDTCFVFLSLIRYT